ncbi:MAG: methionine--tRNA ligase [Melioribacteraceae bacterium]|nr:methionine--tRNA ligase [Melioribacteraceae bacterium]MCF8266094.1 methionine--tRNA ligase [Melioribacteraceae bacterium]MCF8432568.1 methionine--tRNA ligase [Melioribacteraceae bacterium]
MQKEKVLVTSALPYANGHIHLGHLSGAYLPADIYVRYKRLKGDDVLYVCGSDEHGVPITITADKENVKPKEIIDRYHNANTEAFKKFGMSFDIYSRTSKPVHHDDAKTFFLSFHNQGLLNEKKTLQFYDEKANMFLPDRYVEGTCPNCGNEDARSDECENCGALYDPSELLNPKSKITGETPVRKETTHWFFPLGKYQERLEAYIDEMNSKYGWKDNVLQYCKSWFKEGLKDRAVTRDLDWGVRVPLENSEGKVLYVWFEAVLGYISATRDLSEQRMEPDLWKDYWQNPKTKYVAFIGKDNVVFHTIIFPAMLMAWNDGNDEKFVLPQNVPANEFLNFESKKFSKSRGWGIDAKDFLNLFPADPLRYYLAANAPENKDSDFYWKEFQSRNNDELADILGNFVNRTFIFGEKHFESKVPELINPTEIDLRMLERITEYPAKVGALLEKYKVKDAVLEMMNFTRSCNKYFNDSEPWKSVKTNKEQCGTTINICLQAIYTLAELFSPVIPNTTVKLFNMLNARPTDWYNSGNPTLAAGHELNKPEILFAKIDDEKIEEQTTKLEEEKLPPVEDPKISFDDFTKIDLRVGEILEVEKIPKSKKLIKLKVDLGDSQKQILAGVALSYTAEELLGKKVVVVSNLQPAKLMGIESEGMIIAADKKDGGVQILEVSAEIPSGTKVK